MSKKRTRANRKNAQQSTGPKTPSGKAKSSRNSLKHGIHSVSPVVLNFERAEDWDAHRKGISEALAPQGALEAELAERIALLSWRHRRVIRYEREVIAIGQESIEEDLERDRCRELSPPDQGGYHAFQRGIEEVAKNAREARHCAKAVRLLDGTDKKKQVRAVDAWDVLEILADLTKWGVSELMAACVENESDPWRFDGWTIGHLQVATQIAAERAGEGAENLASRALWESKDRAKKWELELATQKQEIEYRKRARVLPEPAKLERITKYEVHLDRAFFQVLHELQRLQAGRMGNGVPIAPALDVNIAVSKDTGTHGTGAQPAAS